MFNFVLFYDANLHIIHNNTKKKHFARLAKRRTPTSIFFFYYIYDIFAVFTILT